MRSGAEKAAELALVGVLSAAGAGVEAGAAMAVVVVVMVVRVTSSQSSGGVEDEGEVACCRPGSESGTPFTPPPPACHADDVRSTDGS